jgi:NAD(P)-dependent dehydrogenase (short-subunit alcohol dehydrogenase family)
MSTPTLVVTGSTGRLGGRVARRLAGAEVVQAAFADADADADAVDEGVEHIVSTSLYGAAPDREVGAWVSTYTAVAAGELAGVSGDVAAIAGHEPRSLAEVLAAVECP